MLRFCHEKPTTSYYTAFIDYIPSHVTVRKRHTSQTVKQQQSIQLPLPKKGDCKTRKDTENLISKQVTNTTHRHSGSNRKQRIKNNNNRSIALAWTAAKAAREVVGPLYILLPKSLY